MTSTEWVQICQHLARMGEQDPVFSYARWLAGHRESHDLYAHTSHFDLHLFASLQHAGPNGAARVEISRVPADRLMLRMVVMGEKDDPTQFYEQRVGVTVDRAKEITPAMLGRLRSLSSDAEARSRCLELRTALF